MFSKKKHISVCGPTCPAPKVTSVLALLLLPSIQALPLRWPVLALLLRTSVHVPQPTFSFFFFFFHLMAHNQHVDYSGIYFQSGYVNYFPWISGKGKTTKHRVQTVYLITTQSWILSHKYIREMQLSFSTFFFLTLLWPWRKVKVTKSSRKMSELDKHDHHEKFYIWYFNGIKILSVKVCDSASQPHWQ